MKFPGKLLVWTSTGLSLLFTGLPVSGILRIFELRRQEFASVMASGNGPPLSREQQMQRFADMQGGLVVHVNSWNLILLAPIACWILVRIFDRPALSTRAGYLATGSTLFFLALTLIFFGALFVLYQ